MDISFVTVTLDEWKAVFRIILGTLTFVSQHTGLCLLQYQSGYQGKDLHLCNVTLSWTTLPKVFSLRQPEIRPRVLDKSLFCRYTFRAPPEHKILIQLSDLHGGTFIRTTKRCKHGYLKIWDGSSDPGRHRYPPNIFCGYYDHHNSIDVSKLSSGTETEMDFFVSYASLMTSFRITVTFLDFANESALDIYPRQLQSYTEQVQNTVCYWRLYLASCPDQCPVLSPGYPGIYPPHTECLYHVISDQDNARLQIKASGFSGKPLEFNLQKNCRTDYVEIYDGSTRQLSRKIGRFCGQYLPNITTSTGNIIIVFVSGSSMPSYEYTGFHFTVISVTKEWHKDGYQLPGSRCSWRFNATAGSISSPEHWLPKKATCEYNIRILPGYYLELIIHIYGLEHNCMDYIQLLDGFSTITRLCDKSMSYSQETFRYNLTSSYITVRYYTALGQMEGCQKTKQHNTIESITKVTNIVYVQGSDPSYLGNRNVPRRFVLSAGYWAKWAERSKDNETNSKMKQPSDMPTSRFEHGWQ
ncbi:hypothetical protein LSH36_163g04036 [Paralvinella palmiformis]|uniref:CUB domain-containing protein n=1 Tax=Paralvinella palmiformis TaxID=53620 RepID=A0AAD9N6F0_9ANNE|nr:hypothetical protein LSH36_163g04036 [Paralvinella palmiformis]